MFFRHILAYFLHLLEKILDTSRIFAIQLSEFYFEELFFRSKKVNLAISQILIF